MPKEKELTIERCMDDFRKAYTSRKSLIEREKEDFLFALGEQWSNDDKEKLQKVGIKPVTDNRIAPNIHLLTGLERQNRTDFKAFPEGEEDGTKAEIATALFKDAVKKSDFGFKSSDQFKDGITCGESHLELYLDFTENLLNGRPVWKKVDGCYIFPEPGFREYDFSDARYVFKLTENLSQDDLISMFPDKRKLIEAADGGKLNYESMLGNNERHNQPRDYGKKGDPESDKTEGFDLLERYYKKAVDHVFIGDMETGMLKEAEDEEKAQGFVDDYRSKLEAEQMGFQTAMEAHQSALMNGLDAGMPPEQPKQRDPERFRLIKRRVQEIWCYAFTPGIEKPLKDAKADFYPNWKSYPFAPFFGRFSTAPLTGKDERHLLIQGLVHGVKGVQEKHNKAEMLVLRHLNTSTNSGWLSEEDSWVDRKKVEQFGTAPGINLEYKKGSNPPQRIQPMPLSVGHAEIAANSAEAVKAQLGINADLLATQDGGSASGRAIALRQRQGLLMVQELFDNLSRTRKIAGRMLLSQLGEIYDTETAKKVLGEAFLRKNFPPVMLTNPDTGQQEPMKDPTGIPMDYDKEMAEVAIAEVLSGNLEEYDVSVGEAVASETMRIANTAEVKEIAQTYPGLIPPDILIEESQLPQSTKTRIMSAIKQAQAAQAAMTASPAAPPPEAPPVPIGA